MTTDNFENISGRDNKRQFAWTSDILSYETAEGTNYAFQQRGEEQNPDIKPTDARGNNLEQITDEILGYEGEPVGINNNGYFVGYDGLEFTVYDPTNSFEVERRVERDWDTPNPIETYVRNEAKHEGPWIITEDDYEGTVKQDGIDLSQVTIIDKHAASRWNERGDTINYDNIVEELSNASIHPVPDDQHDDLSFDFIREGQESGTIFLQKGNRIVSTVPGLDRHTSGPRKRAMWDILK